MFTEELKRVPLTISEIMTLMQMVDNERKRVRKMMKEHPDADKENRKRESYISTLDGLTKSLTASIG